MKTIEQELQELRELFQVATDASMRLFDKTMQIHGRSPQEREEVVEGERWVQQERARKMLIEYEQVLRSGTGTIQ